MEDGLEVSFHGREGSGFAQILTPIDMSAWQNANQEAIDKERKAQRDRDIKASDDFKKDLELDFDSWSKDLPELQDELQDVRVPNHPNRG